MVNETLRKRVSPRRLPALLRHAFGDDQPMALLGVAFETKQADRLNSNEA